MGKRRGHGDGAIYQRASDGRWTAAVEAPQVSGKRRRKTVYGTTRAEVAGKLRDLHVAQAQGQDLGQRTRTLRAWLEEWADTRRPDLRYSTMRSYDWLIASHIVPVLGKKRLDRLTASDVSGLIMAKRATLSPTTVGHILRLLRTALTDAERHGLVNRNVADAVRPPKPAKVVHRALTAAEARHLLAVSRPHRLHALFAATLFLALRRSEVLGLCWEDVHLDAANPSLFIRHGLHRTKDGLVLLPPKTAESRATLPLPPPLVRVLTAHRKRQARERLVMGSRWPGSDFVFTSSTGGPIDPRNLDRQWAKIRKSAGLPHMRFHDLRGGCATLLASLGVHPRVIMRMMRHTTVAMSMEVYASVAPAMEREACDSLSDLLFG